MTKLANDMSVAQLEKLLHARKSQLDSLTKQRERLQRELDRVERKISSIEGTNGVVRRRPSRRPRNEKSLHALVNELLGKNRKGYSLADLAEKVLESGYKTNSTNFKNVLYQCLYNADEIEHDPTSGNYRLKQ